MARLGVTWRALEGSIKGTPSPIFFVWPRRSWEDGINWAVNSGRLTQILKPPRYLLYADDILIFAKATPRNIRRVKNTMLRTTGISEGSLSFSYLGVPIFRGSPRTCHLATMADSIIAKFSKWKGHSLSLAGRKCMVNSVIAASLVHSMMVYYWSRSLLKRIESAMRNFL
ncbi:hypothetical protein ACS0TY_010833 [Phlomoides rotata]